jgi:mannosidase alpha-like ER degradation enhancer 1
MLTTFSKLDFQIPEYRGELLWLAYDLGLRLLPAFHASQTGIPFSRISLKYGLMASHWKQNCPAGAGTFIMEFGLLSRLTKDPRFEVILYTESLL